MTARCTCPTTRAAALDCGGTWTDEDCPLHGAASETDGMTDVEPEVRIMQSTPDGGWEPADPQPMHPGIFWEVYGKRGERRTAIAYRGHTEVARLTGPLLSLRMALCNRRLNR